MKLTEEQMQAAWDKYERGDGLSRDEIRALLEQISPALAYLRQRSAKFGTLIKSETVLTAERLMSFDLELQSLEEAEVGTLKILVDLDGVEEADNEVNATTYYGGQWKVGEKTGRGWGDDRSDSHLDDVEDEVKRLVTEKWPDVDLAEEPDDEEESLRGLLAQGGRFMLTVRRDDDGDAPSVSYERTP